MKELCGFSEQGWGVGWWWPGHLIQIVNFTKISPTSSSHSLLKMTRIYHLKICYCCIMIILNQSQLRYYSHGKNNSLPSPILLKAGQTLSFIKMSPSPVPGREKQLLIPGTLNHLRQHDSYQTRDWYLINLCDKLCKMLLSSIFLEAQIPFPLSCPFSTMYCCLLKWYISLWVWSSLWGLHFISVRTLTHIQNKPSPVYLSLVISICRTPGTELKRVEEKQFCSPTFSGHKSPFLASTVKIRSYFWHHIFKAIA